MTSECASKSTLSTFFPVEHLIWSRAKHYYVGRCAQILTAVDGVQPSRCTPIFTLKRNHAAQDGSVCAWEIERGRAGVEERVGQELHGTYHYHEGLEDWSRKRMLLEPAQELPVMAKM